MLATLQLCDFTLCREVGVALWLHQPAASGLADVFLLGQELGGLANCPVLQLSLLSFCVLLAHQDAKGHHSKISAPPSTWQQKRCTDGVGAAVRSSRVWQRPYSVQPTPSHRQTDALKMEECTQMGCCLLFRPSWYLFIELNIARNAWTDFETVGPWTCKRPPKPPTLEQDVSFVSLCIRMLMMCFMTWPIQDIWGRYWYWFLKVKKKHDNGILVNIRFLYTAKFLVMYSDTNIYLQWANMGWYISQVISSWLSYASFSVFF